MKSSFFWIFIGILAFSTSCKKGLTPEEQLEKDIQAIKEYVAANELDAIETKSGLHYVVFVEGTGQIPFTNDDVTVRYKGYFLDGKVFDQSDEIGSTFNLQKVISGWTEGIPKFREGGKGMLLIPSALGYGVNGSGSIEPNSVLIFDVELLTIVD